MIRWRPTIPAGAGIDLTSFTVRSESARFPARAGKLSGHRIRSSCSAVIANNYKYRSADPAVSPRV